VASLSAFLTYVLPYAPGAMEPIVERAVLDAVRKFCRLARVIEETLADIAVTSANHTYALASAVADDEVVLVQRALLDGRALTPATPGDLAGEYENWEGETGPPRFYTQPTEGSIRLVPKPDSSGTLVVTAVTAPKITATTVNDVMLDKWREAVECGARAYLYGIPNQPFSSDEKAEYYAQKFMQKVGAAGFVAAKGNSRAPLRVPVVHGVQ
jgi:hypothetical protein